jgi:hypothetical protein
VRRLGSLTGARIDVLTPNVCERSDTSGGSASTDLRIDRVDGACRLRGVNEDLLRDGAPVDLRRRQPFDQHHHPATAGAWP